MNTAEVSKNNRTFIVPFDITQEELIFLDIVKQKMLQKLDDRQKFLFLYIFELGKTQKDTAAILGVHEITIARHLEQIRDILSPFKH